MYSLLIIFLGGAIIGFLAGYVAFHHSEYEDFYEKKGWKEGKDD